MNDIEIKNIQEIQIENNIDLLNREEFIRTVISYVNYYSEQKESISFSINGEWGSGKSWVIDNIINELYEIQSDETYSDRFCVFKYNAWDFDYYEEPLIALIISIKEQIDSENAVFIKSKTGLAKWEATKKVIKTGAYEGFHKLLKKAEEIKILPFTPTTASISTAIKAIGFIGNKAMNLNDKIKDELENNEKAIKEYDDYFDLKGLIKNVKDSFSQLTKDRTVVIVIDELDRCLPEYAIKVLERIHHLCEGIENIQFIYAIDDKQLANTVKQIFGEEVSIRSYLSKFMTFGLRLPEAFFNELIENKFMVFNSIFVFEYSTPCSLFEILSTPLGNIPIRQKMQIIEKIKIANQLVLHNIKDYDFSILLFELFIAYCDYFEVNLKEYSISDMKISPKSQKDLKKITQCNDMLERLLESIVFPDMGSQSTYTVTVNLSVYEYLPFYLSLYCSSFDGLSINCIDLILKKKSMIQKALNNFWKYYKNMEL